MSDDPAITAPTPQRRWPQFQLWRLLVATALLGAAMACFCVPLGELSSEMDLAPFVPRFVGMVLFAGAVGTPFRKGLVMAICAPLVLFVLALLLETLLG